MATRLLTLLLATALLSGCLGGGGSSGSDDVDSGNGGDPVEPAEPVLPPEPTLVVIPVDMEGNLGNMVHGCIFAPVVHCETHELSADITDYYHEHNGAELVAADLTLTWDAITPATMNLGFDLMVMGPNSTMLSEEEGSSPLTINVPAMAHLLGPEDRVHAYVFNPDNAPGTPVGYTYHTFEQSFTISGSITLLVPN